MDPWLLGVLGAVASGVLMLTVRWIGRAAVKELAAEVRAINIRTRRELDGTDHTNGSMKDTTDRVEQKVDDARIQASEAKVAAKTAADRAELVAEETAGIREDLVEHTAGDAHTFAEMTDYAHLTQHTLRGLMWVITAQLERLHKTLGVAYPYRSAWDEASEDEKVALALARAGMLNPDGVPQRRADDPPPTKTDTRPPHLASPKENPDD